MLVRLLYIVLLALLVRLLIRALVERTGPLRRRVRGPGDAGESRTLHRGTMVRDPNCGLHLPQDRALSELRGGDRVYFCSERCRDEFREASA